MTSTSSESSVAWISRGRLFVKTAGHQTREIESAFATDALRRQVREASLDAWKGRSGVWGNMGIQPPGIPPWESEDVKRKMKFVSVARGGSPDEIYYVLDMGSVGGLFLYNLSSDTERRLIHQQSFLPQNISRHSADGELAFSLHRVDGTTGLHITRHDGLLGRNIDLSDAMDDAPSWMPDGSKQLVYHSSMLARNEHGVAIGKSPSQIEKLDLKDGVMNTMHHEEGHDLIQPRVMKDGSLVFIRRPYQAILNQRFSLLQILWDILCVPFRLLLTFFSIFSFLSMMFTGKPLMNNVGIPAPKKNVDPVLVLWGQAIDTQRALSRKGASHSHNSIVPKEWELVSRTSDGKETRLADSVATWDVTPDGSIAWSDGRSIFVRNPSGDVRTVADGDVIEQFTILS